MGRQQSQRTSPTTLSGARLKPSGARRRPLPAHFVAVDVETTGFSPATDRIIEIAIVWFDAQATSARIERQASYRVDPCRPIPPVVRTLTGINDAEVRGLPRFRAVADAVVDALADAPCVVAYNAPFDRRFLSSELARAGKTLPNSTWIDVLALVRHVEPRVRSHALAPACERHGIALDDAHHAASDARATGELFARMAAVANASQWRRHVPDAVLESSVPLTVRLRERVLTLFS
jgi:DNA polymerase-3 subunit epsilon